jgi:hypothetical protein
VSHTYSPYKILPATPSATSGGPPLAHLPALWYPPPMSLLALLGCVPLPVYNVPPVLVTDLTDRGEVEVQLGPGGAAVAVGLTPAYSFHASGAYTSLTDIRTVTHYQDDPNGERAEQSWPGLVRQSEGYSARFGLGGRRHHPLGNGWQRTIGADVDVVAGHSRSYLNFVPVEFDRTSETTANDPVLTTRYSAFYYGGMIDGTLATGGDWVTFGGGLRYEILRFEDDGSEVGFTEETWGFLGVYTWLRVYPAGRDTNVGLSPLFLQGEVGIEPGPYTNGLLSTGISPDLRATTSVIFASAALGYTFGR